MAGLAEATERMRIGSLVFGNTYRHPAVLANEIATIDEMSGGRVLFGLGAGWQENEHRAFGIELPPPKQRLDRFEEAVQIVKGLFANERFSFKGEYYVIDDAPMSPSRADMKLLIGGSGEKRTMRIAAEHADEWNTWSTPEIMRGKLEVLRGHCDALGRDFDDIAVSTQALIFMNEDDSALDGIRNAQLPMPTMIGTPQRCGEILAEYHALGVDEFIVPDFTLPRQEVPATIRSRRSPSSPPLTAAEGSRLPAVAPPRRDRRPGASSAQKTRGCAPSWVTRTAERRSRWSTDPRASARVRPTRGP